jgi:hypothetical protein
MRKLFTVVATALGRFLTVEGRSSTDARLRRSFAHHEGVFIPRNGCLLVRPYRCACRRYWGPRYNGYYGWR